MGFPAEEIKLPVIDLTNKITEDYSSWPSTSNEVLRALEQYGCFVAAYEHQQSVRLHDSMFNAFRPLFDLPMETKVKNSSRLCGFGYGGGFKTMPLFEYFGIENGSTTQGIQHFTNLMWPAGNHSFSETAASYSKLITELANLVLRMVHERYGVKKYYKSHVETLSYLMRFIKYRAPMNEDNNVGLHSHTDCSVLTILDQNLVKGLEIETKGGDWITFHPSPYTFLVIAGEGFMAWSNGRIYAPLHRVVMSGREEKYTIGMFAFKSGVVETPEELVDEEHPLQYKPFDHYGFLHYCAAGEGSKQQRPLKAFCGL